MTFRNMAVIRLCCIFVFFLCLHRITGKPMFDTLFCDLFFCDDDDVSTTTNANSEYDYCDCSPRRRTTTTPRPSNPMSVVIPASNTATNVTWVQNGGNWFFGMYPIPASGVTTAPAAPPAPAGPTTATAAPAAPGATTAATTAAG